MKRRVRIRPALTADEREQLITIDKGFPMRHWHHMLASQQPSQPEKAKYTELVVHVPLVVAGPPEIQALARAALCYVLRSKRPGHWVSFVRMTTSERRIRQLELLFIKSRVGC